MNDKNEMCAQRKSFAFYSSFKDAIGDMSDADKLSVYESITDFAFFGIEPTELTPIGRLAWKLIRPQLAASMKRYDTSVENGRKGAKYGKLGGAPKGNNNARKTTPESTPKTTPEDNPKNNPLNHNLNDNHNLNENGGYKGDKVATKRAAFVAPTRDDIIAYGEEEGLRNVDPDVFMNHYEAIGWQMGKTPIKDWRAAARGWNARQNEFTHNKKQTNYETRPKYDSNFD